MPQMVVRFPERSAKSQPGMCRHSSETSIAPNASTGLKSRSRSISSHNRSGRYAANNDALGGRRPTAAPSAVVAMADADTAHGSGGGEMEHRVATVASHTENRIVSTTTRQSIGTEYHCSKTELGVDR